MVDMRRITGMRKAISVWLMAALLGVSPAAAFTALLGYARECGSQCCRAKRKCCCRKPKAAGASEVSLSAKACRVGCCQPLALGAGAAAMESGSVVLSQPRLLAAQKGLHSSSVARIVHTCYALWQRPPPVNQPLSAQG